MNNHIQASIRGTGYGNSRAMNIFMTLVILKINYSQICAPHYIHSQRENLRIVIMQKPFANGTNRYPNKSHGSKSNGAGGTLIHYPINVLSALIVRIIRS